MEQLGLRLKEQGLNLVYWNNQNFVDEMREVAKRKARGGRQITVECLREYAADKGIAPYHPNAWGAIFRTNDWERVGFRQSHTVSARARMISIWRLKD